MYGISGAGGGAQKRPLGKRQKAQLERQRRTTGGGAAAARSGVADPEALATITECASALLEGGEHDVYS